MRQNISIVIDPICADTETAVRIREKFGAKIPGESALADQGRSPDGSGDAEEESLTLKLDAEGLALISGGQTLRGDFLHMLPRLRHNDLPRELLVKTAKIKSPEGPLTAVDATAGLGEDSLLLAAAGFHVKMYEKNPVIFELLRDTLRRAAETEELAEIVERMELFNEDSVIAMAKLEEAPDVILLDPMFPERQKSALVKKKLQVIQKLEIPCVDEREILLAAINAGPKKLIIKRPPKGPYLAGLKPDHSTAGKAVRFDCIVSPRDRLHKFKI